MSAERQSHMNFRLYHDVTFDVLYACILVLVYVALERAIYLGYLSWRMHRLAALAESVGDAAKSIGALPGRDPATKGVQRYLEAVAQGASRERQEDYSSALFIGFDKRVSARLWILDTIVTAAPLLGLLGTIFGIMETFNALAAGGVSDPAAVSRGIGTALIATAIGIATALLGLVANNVLNRRVHVLTEDFKALLLTTALLGQSNERVGVAGADGQAVAPKLAFRNAR
jgi:biopolymer transport protein ExbB